MIYSLVGFLIIDFIGFMDEFVVLIMDGIYEL